MGCVKHQMRKYCDITQHKLSNGLLGEYARQRSQEKAQSDFHREAEWEKRPGPIVTIPVYEGKLKNNLEY